MNDQLAPASTTAFASTDDTAREPALDRVPDSALDEPAWLALLIQIDQEEGGP